MLSNELTKAASWRFVFRDNARIVRVRLTLDRNFHRVELTKALSPEMRKATKGQAWYHVGLPPGFRVIHGFCGRTRGISVSKLIKVGHQD